MRIVTRKNGRVYALGQSESEARRHFGVDVEECEGCGLWSASYADHEDGAIVGSYCDDSGEALLDRVCEECCELSPEELGL